MRQKTFYYFLQHQHMKAHLEKRHVFTGKKKIHIWVAGTSRNNLNEKKIVLLHHYHNFTKWWISYLLMIGYNDIEDKEYQFLHPFPHPCLSFSQEHAGLEFFSSCSSEAVINFYPVPPLWHFRIQSLFQIWLSWKSPVDECLDVDDQLL